jgi:HEAT repeat protein
MDRRIYLGFVVFPAGIAAMLAFLFFVAKVDIFRHRTVEQSIAELASHPDSGVRAKAALDLMRDRDERALTPLRAALRDQSLAVRLAASQALATVSTATAVADLRPLLADEKPEVRRFVAYVFGQLGDERAREPLRGDLGDANEAVRWNAAVALARLHDRSGLAVLHDMLRAPVPRGLGGAARTLVPGADAPEPEPDRAVHANALLALALVGGPESVRPIETFVEADVEPDLNDMAREVVQKIKRNQKP